MINFTLMEALTRNCRSCGKPLKGRTDKKYCDDYCRSIHNNSLHAEASVMVRHVNSILKKNRRMLQEIIPTGEELGKCPRDKLAGSGFNFRFFTHQYTNKKGNIYHFVYEYGYLPLEGNWILVVRRKETSD
jgi:hypothetical protein